MNREDEHQEILDFLRSEQDSYYRGDYDAFIAHWHHGPEVRRILSGPDTGTRIHIGWNDLCAKFKEGFRQYPQDYDAREMLRWDNIQVQSTGEMAWITYDQIMLKHAQSLHAAPMSHETKIIQKFDGQWKIVCIVVVSPGLGRADVPRIELNAQGCVVDRNLLAQARLPKHAGLTVSHGRPRARNRAYDAGLQSAISMCRARLATNLPRGFSDEPVSVVPLGEDDEGHAMFCWVLNEQERILITFDDQYLLHGRLQAAGVNFGLSPAQLQLSEHLALGLELPAVARMQGVSVHTVRTQVKRMFDKTGTHNRAALISRLLNANGPG